MLEWAEVCWEWQVVVMAGGVVGHGSGEGAGAGEVAGAGWMFSEGRPTPLAQRAGWLHRSRRGVLAFCVGLSLGAGWPAAGWAQSAVGGAASAVAPKPGQAGDLIVKFRDESDIGLALAAGQA